MYNFLVELTATGKLFDGFQPLLICGPLNKTSSLMSITGSCQSEISNVQRWEESLQDAWKRDLSALHDTEVWQCLIHVLHSPWHHRTLLEDSEVSELEGPC